MASSVFNSESNIGYVGFKQSHYNSDSRFNIGKGINEGYTQLLTLRYFGKKHKMTLAYKFEVSIVEKLEKISDIPQIYTNNKCISSSYKNNL